MEGLNFPKTDPTPYIVAAYAIGVIFLAGYAVWQVHARRQLRRLLDTVRVKK